MEVNMRSRLNRIGAILALLFVVFVGSQVAYTGVPVAHASTVTPGYVIPTSSGIVGVIVVILIVLFLLGRL